MTTRKCFINDRGAIPDVAQITGLPIIQLEYEFDKAAILGVVCVIDVELTADQAAEIDRKAKVRRETAAKARKA